MAMPAGGVTVGPRVALFVDYENLYYEDTRAYGPEGVRHLASDLFVVARQCGPVALAEAIAPFDDIPGAADAFHEAGFDPVFSPGGRIRNAADLKVVQRLMSLDERAGIGVVFLVSGDQHMVGAVRHAQKHGLLVAVVSCKGSLSGKLKVSADRAFHVRDIREEAYRLRRSGSPELGLEEWASAWCRRGRSEGPEESPEEGPGDRGEADRHPAPPPASEPPVLAPGRTMTSPSVLKDYARCPRRYRLLHVERREEPPSVAIFVGTVVHQALKSFFRLEPADRSWQALEATLRRAWATATGRDEVFASREDEASAGRQALADLKGFYGAADRRVVPFELEVFLTTQVGDGITVRGKVDRIDRVPGKQGLVIIDYKTGKVPAQEPNLIDEFQLPLYQAMVTEAYSRSVEKVVLYYLKGDTQFEFRLEAPDVDRAKAHALDLVRRIAADTEFAARPGPLCRFCSFLAGCPARADVEARYTREAKRPDPDPSDLPF